MSPPLADTIPQDAVPLDDEAFCRALQASGQALTALAARMLDDADAARDAVQEAWIRAWGARATLRDPDALGGWVRKIVVRECLRTLRWRTLRRTFGLDRAPEPSHADDASSVLEAEQARRAVIHALEALPARQRIAWTLHVEEGWTLAEVAAALEVSPETVKTHLARATARVKEAIDAL